MDVSSGGPNVEAIMDVSNGLGGIELDPFGL